MDITVITVIASALVSIVAIIGPYYFIKFNDRKITTKQGEFLKEEIGEFLKEETEKFLKEQRKETGGFLRELLKRQRWEAGDLLEEFLREQRREAGELLKALAERDLQLRGLLRALGESASTDFIEPYATHSLKAFRPPNFEPNHGKIDSASDITAFQIRIDEEPLTTQKLASTLTALVELYTKSWLIQQGRFNDAIKYNDQKEQYKYFEEEASLLIGKLKYNSPITINIDPKGFWKVLKKALGAVLYIKEKNKALELDNQGKVIDNEGKRLKLEKRRIEWALEASDKLIDELYPDVNEKIKPELRRILFGNLLELGSDETFQIVTIPKIETTTITNHHETLLPTNQIASPKKEVNVTDDTLPSHQNPTV